MIFAHEQNWLGALTVAVVFLLGWVAFRGAVIAFSEWLAKRDKGGEE